MVKVNPTGKEEFYMDGILKDNLDLCKSKIKDDWDFAFLIAGVEGGGKSTFAFQLASYCSGTRFTNEHVCFSPEDFMKKMSLSNFLKAGDSLVLDEAFIINSRASMTTLNRLFISMMAECRQKNLFLFITLPNFFDMDKNIALWRTRGLFYIYHDRMERGYFKFYGYEQKKKLYLLGKKLYNYNSTKPDFFGRFPKYFPFNIEEYKKNKLKAFEFKINNPHSDKHLEQRNNLLRFCVENGASQSEIARYLKNKGTPLSQRLISDVLSTQKLAYNTNNLTSERDLEDGEEA